MKVLGLYLNLTKFKSKLATRGASEVTSWTATRNVNGSFRDKGSPDQRSGGGSSATLRVTYPIYRHQRTNIEPFS